MGASGETSFEHLCSMRVISSEGEFLRCGYGVLPLRSGILHAVHCVGTQ